MNEELDDVIYYQWRVVSDTGPWKQRKGARLRWEMTEKEAASWQQVNPQTTIEKVPGTGSKRAPVRNSSSY